MPFNLDFSILSKLKTKYSISIFIGTICFLLLQNISRAQNDSEYNQGLSLYKQKKYSKAAEHFWRSITAGNASANTWLYMAHAYSAAGNKEKAADSYKQIAKIFAGKPAGKMASMALAKIGSIPSSGKGAVTGATTTATSSSSSFSKFVKPKSIDPNDYRKFRLIDRVITVPPNKKFFNYKAILLLT